MALVVPDNDAGTALPSAPENPTVADAKADQEYKVQYSEFIHAKVLDTSYWNFGQNLVSPAVSQTQRLQPQLSMNQLAYTLLLASQLLFPVVIPSYNHYLAAAPAPGSVLLLASQLLILVIIRS